MTGRLREKRTGDLLVLWNRKVSYIVGRGRKSWGVVYIWYVSAVCRAGEDEGGWIESRCRMG